MYKIIIDSCGELTEEMKTGGHFVNVPLTLTVDGIDIIDDETFDQADFLERVRNSAEGPKSACPSPQSYMQEMEGPETHIYVVTLSSQLSGSYNAAVLAKELFIEEHPVSGKKIHIFDSKSASIGQTLTGRKIESLEGTGLSFEEIIKKTDEYIARQNTFFTLETLETFRKTGRLSNLTAKIISTLNIKPIMASTETGYIHKAGQARGMAAAMDKMAELLLQLTPDPEARELAISHCNCPLRAQALKQKLESLAKFRHIFILDTRGVSSMYANDGGVIVVA